MPRDRRDEILDAAGKCFARYGYDKATMDDIGALVGMNKVSLYYYFDNKEALFREMLRREAAAYASRMEERIGKVSGCRERVLAWIELSFKFGSGSAVLRQVSGETLGRLSPLLEDFRAASLASSEARIASLLEEGRAAGEIGGCEAGRLAAAIVALIGAAKDAAGRRFRASPGRKVDTARAVEDVKYAVGLMLDGVAAPREARARRR